MTLFTLAFPQPAAISSILRPNILFSSQELRVSFRLFFSKAALPALRENLQDNMRLFPRTPADPMAAPISRTQRH
jgi:hypothetical protein